ncbi:MAG: TonB-dependent receptor [Deltaproteobacteria bacterium]|nr:TonB-dependent receptor [Deltaproteobacteria bacterium]
MRPPTPLLLLALAAAGPGLAVAQSPGALTRAPAVVEPAAPVYPPAARAAGRSAEVVLELELSAEGRVAAARVLQPAGDGFDEAALEAGRRLRFSPAEVDGSPSAVVIEYRFRFEAPAAPPPAPRAILRGQVLERGTREPIPGALVAACGKTGISGGDGRFALLDLPPGPCAVSLSDPGHERFVTEELLEAGKAVEARYYLLRALDDPYQAVVVGERERKEVTTVTVTSGELSRVAGVSGDTVKVVQNLPGVARAPGGLGLLVVRGGNPGDTRVYVDGVEVPTIFHFGGLTSIVPAEAVEAVDFEAGNFGVRHGRATGGMVELRTRDPQRKLHLVADANLFHAMAFAEGPVGEGATLSVGLRRSYADAVVREAARSSKDFGVAVAPRYYDYQARLAWRPGPDDALRLSVTGSDDRMELTGMELGGNLRQGALRLGNAFVQGAASWEHRFSDATRARLAVAQAYFDVSRQMGSVGSERDQLHITNLRAETSHDLSASLGLAVGVDARFLPRAHLRVEFPLIPPPNQLPSPDAPRVRAELRLRGTEAGAWAEARWSPAASLQVVAGLRGDRYTILGAARWLDPRLGVRWSPREGTTLKGGAGLYHQPVQAAAYRTEQWGNPRLGPEGARHFMLGLEQRVAGPVSLDLQLYRKQLFDLALPVEGPERYANLGTGQVTGAELLLRWAPGGRFGGWLSYSYSRSVRHQQVVGGTLVPTGDAFDQPHNLTALGTVELPEVWQGLSAGFRLRYTSGNPYRRVLGALLDADGGSYQPVPELAAGARTPPFFQLDLRVDKRWTWKTWILSAYLEVQNATNRKNPELAAYSYDYSRQGWASGLPLFPAFGIRAEY